MNAVLAQRKYRLAANLATGTAKTFGLGAVALFAAALIASMIYREATGNDEEFAYLAIMAVPLIMTVLAWANLYKAYPRALANGVTRKEALGAFAIYAAATVLTAAALTRLGILVIDLRDAAHETGFYGLTPLESLVRPALYFALGAAAAAAMLRFGKHWAGAVVAALMVGSVVFRPVVVSFVLNQIDGPATTTVERIYTPLDTAMTVVFALIAWALLARAPMRPKPA